jgi:hypothetical protein
MPKTHDSSVKRDQTQRKSSATKSRRPARRHELPGQMDAALRRPDPTAAPSQSAAQQLSSSLQVQAIVQLEDRLNNPTPAPFQGESGPQPSLIHQAAQRGIVGAGAKLPYLESIQRSFGRHDVSSIQAHTDSAAAASARDMNAEAFATGNHVVFGGAPNLKTAAHEAAHIVQQRAGVQLKGGVGEVGDPYERHADEVAERVGQGKSAEDLLDRFVPAGRREGITSWVQSKAVVQRLPVVKEITEDEEAAITAYKGDQYKYFNFYLRGQQMGSKKVSGMGPMVADLTSALTKMSNVKDKKYSYTGTLYRGDKFTDYPDADQTLMDTKGEDITIASFFSTTKTKSVAEAYGPDIWKVTSNINGVDIHGAGVAQAAEGEVLFPPGSVFNITAERHKVGMVKPFGTRSRKISATQSG